MTDNLILFPAVVAIILLIVVLGLVGSTIRGAYVDGQSETSGGNRAE